MKERILKLRALGKTYNEIVSAVGCSKSVVAYHCNKKVRDNALVYKNLTRKKQMVDLKNLRGAKCEICGYNRCLSALHFHHKNPTEKRDEVNHLLRSSGIRIATEETKKCILVCSNCHAEIHENEEDYAGEHFQCVA